MVRRKFEQTRVCAPDSTPDFVDRETKARKHLLAFEELACLEELDLLPWSVDGHRSTGGVDDPYQGHSPMKPIGNLVGDLGCTVIGRERFDDQIGGKSSVLPARRT